MAILNSLPSKIGMATETSNGLMSYEDKILVNKINRIESDVADKMNKNEKIKSSQLDTSNNSSKIQLVNLSKEVIDAMTQHTAISSSFTTELGSINRDHLADNAVSSDKRTAVGSVAVIVSSDPCNFNTTGDDEVVLSIPADYSIYFGADKRDIVNTPEALTLPKGEPSVITYSKIYGFTAYSGIQIYEDDFLVGAFDGENVTMFNGRYTVNGSIGFADGSLSGSAIKDFSIDSNKIAIQHGIMISDETLAPYINANFISKFVEVIKDIDISIADQYAITIKASDSCIIPENEFSNRYLYIYYDLGLGRLNALWASNDTTNTILKTDDKVVLLSIIDTINHSAVGLNKQFVSVNSTSIKNMDIAYIDIFNGKITIDFNKKQIVSNGIKAFVDANLIDLTESESSTINLTDEMIADIINSEISYTLACTRVDFDSDSYRLVFGRTENIRSLGLDTIYLTTIKKYHLTNNRDNIAVIKLDGTKVKSNMYLSEGYILPFDNSTIAVTLTTETIDGNLNLTSSVNKEISVIDPVGNSVYTIDQESIYTTTIKDLHGIYRVFFNTETGKIEIIRVSDLDFIDIRVYIDLGSVYELSDSLAYTAYGPIKNHITLNGNRPANYTIIDGPDPDKGYDWSDNRLVVPNDIYLMSNSQYSFYCQNMSMNKYIDNDYILYEMGLPHCSVLTENVLNINSPINGEFETRIVGKFKGNNNCLFKDFNIHFEKPEGKELSILCIGDDTVDMNMPGHIKQYLTQLGYNPIMLGKTKNVINANGYGLKGIPEEFGEGHKGWRMTDFMCKTRRKDNSPYYIENNPFMNESKFDFAYYMTSNSYEKVDVVVISVGLNDIIGYHTASATEEIETLTISENIERLPNMYKEMIANIHSYDSNIKIIINPTMIKGIDDDFNRKSLMLTETLVYELNTIQNVFFAPGYMTQPMFASINIKATESYEQYNGINNTKIGSSSDSTEINGVGQSILAYTIVSTIVGVTK